MPQVACVTIDQPQQVLVYDYPEADSMISHYTQVKTDLSAYKTSITAKINSAQSRHRTIDTNAVSSLADGAYYDAFLQCKEEWLNDYQAQIDVFNTFLTNLDTNIQNADQKISEWQYKKTLYHYE